MERMPMVVKDGPRLNWQFIVDRLKAMNDEKFKASLIKAGVIDECGKLTEHYRRK